MRWTNIFIPTLKETPQDAEIASHQLLLRAGLVRKLSAGLYTFLPMGLRALRKVERIVREEINRAGAQEVLMPALHPKELWEATGRFGPMEEVMFTFSDRQNRELLLGPTHEEPVTDMVSKEIKSYRQLPLNFYQIQTKFRDEIRPRFGLMRAKEFIMKDAYSFDADWEGARVSYDAMYQAYVRIFRRCGLRTKIVEADSGDMGGSTSHEFMVLADSGEDGIVECGTCDYAANLERAEGLGRNACCFEGHERATESVATPDQRTIEQVSAFLQRDSGQLIKTMIYLADGNPVAVLVGGGREVHEVKLKRALKANAIELADDEVIRRVTGAPAGFAGPVGLAIRTVADRKLKGFQGAVAGANEADHHLVNVDLERDAKVESYHDLVYAKTGDGCPRCDGTLEEKRGVEVGHVFQLGTKYSEALGATFLDADGQEQVMIMGCYGIGVTRTMQAIIEQRHDKFGVQWPISISPFDVLVSVLNPLHGQTMEQAERIVDELEASGLEVLVDDRDERPGFKFKDADLIGIPIRVTVGEKSLAKGGAEIKLRGAKDYDLVPLEQVAARIQELASRMFAELEPESKGSSD